MSFGEVWDAAPGGGTRDADGAVEMIEAAVPGVVETNECSAAEDGAVVLPCS